LKLKHGREVKLILRKREAFNLGGKKKKKNIWEREIAYI
jgi:hypothetical protein